MTATADPRVGTRLGAYEIEGLLGRGGMSVVYVAVDTRLGRKVALKILAAELSADERFRERFLRESRTAASLDHAHIVPVYEAGEDRGQLFISMRYVEGDSLATLIAQEGSLSSERTVALAAQLASALDHAHEHGLVHRDVKPSNALVTPAGGEEHVYLADFGLTRPAAVQTTQFDSGQFVGTASYTAPEQIERKTLDRRADVYSLACLVYECLTGEPPFSADSLMALLFAHVNDDRPAAAALRPDLPPDVDRVLARGMARDPADRFGTCGDFVDAFRAVLEAGHVPLSRKLAWAWNRWSRRPAALAAATVVVAAAAGAAVFVTHDGGGVAAATTKPTHDVVQRIDPATNRLVASVDTGARVDRVAAGAAGVWALDTAGGTFTRIDVAGDRPAGRGSTLGDPASIGVGSNSVWIARAYGSKANNGTLLRIDPTSPQRADVFTFATVQNGYAAQTLGDLAVVDGAATNVWIVSPDERAVKRVNAIGTLVATIPTGAVPPRAIAAGAGAVWVAKAWTLERIDPATNHVVARVPLAFRPDGVAVGDGRVWLTDGLGHSVWTVDPRTNTIAGRLHLGGDPEPVTFGFGGVWVADVRGGTVYRIDPAALRVTAAIRVGGRPQSISAGARGVWVATRGVPERDLSVAEYTAAVAEAMRSAYLPARDLLDQLFTQSWAMDRHYSAAVSKIEPRTFTLLAELYRGLLADVAALRPPPQLAGAHTRIVVTLRSMQRYERLRLRAVHAQRWEQVAALDQQWSNVWQDLWSGLPPGLQRVFPYDTLSFAMLAGSTG